MKINKAPLIFVLGFAMLFVFLFITFDAVTTTTTDISKYERVLKLTGYPNNLLTEYFPNKIPDNAKDIIFSYNPAFLQGGEMFGLKFKIDINFINSYINELSQKAKWIGKSSENQAEENGIFSSAFDFLGYTDLPEDFTIYLINSKPYHLNDWNHGELSLVAISKNRDEIIFLAEDW